MTPMTSDKKEGSIDWSLTTWEGNRRAQLRQWQKLSLRERLEALEAMNETAAAFAAARHEGRLRGPRGS